jgi:hypothetical protein
MTEDEETWLEQANIRERARLALEGANQTLEQLAERRRRRLEGVEPDEWTVPSREPVHPIQRPPHVARNWDDEARWIGQIINGKLAVLKAELTEAFGIVIGKERELVRRELRAAITEARANDLEAMIRKLDQLMAKLVEHSDAVELGRMAVTSAGTQPH